MSEIDEMAERAGEAVDKYTEKRKEEAAEIEERAEKKKQELKSPEGSAD